MNTINLKRSFDQLAYGNDNYGDDEDESMMIVDYKRPKLLTVTSTSPLKSQRRLGSGSPYQEESTLISTSPARSSTKPTKFTTPTKDDNGHEPGAAGPAEFLQELGIDIGETLMSDGDSGTGSHGPGKRQPMFTFEQAQAMGEKYLRDHEQRIRERFDLILNRELSNHYERLVQFTQKKVQDMAATSEVTYFS